MKIVCGTDFSQHAGEAAAVAGALAGRLRATLTLVHVFDPSRHDHISKELLDKLREQRDAQLQAQATALRQAGITVEEKLLDGPPPIRLAECAHTAETGLIVVSSIGHVAPSRWFVGSIAERTAQSATVPTLVVRGQEAFLDWTAGKRPLHILVGYDFSPAADSALRWVGTLRHFGACRITVAFVDWPPREVGRLGVGDHHPLLHNPPEIQSILERDLKHRCEEIFGKPRVHIRVVAGWGRPDPQLLELAKTEGADLIVVGTHQRHGLERVWLGSVSRGVLHHAPVSVACVPVPVSGPPEAGAIPRIRRVLVPTDFSQAANHAIPIALSTLQRGGVLCLLHVGKPGKRLPKASKTDIESRLHALVPSDAALDGIQLHPEAVEHAHPAEAIVQAAERFAADLICIGSRNKTGIAKALGSVTQSVLTQTRRPVLVVRPSED